MPIPSITNAIKHNQKIMEAEDLYAVIEGFYLMNAGEDHIASKAKALWELDFRGRLAGTLHCDRGSLPFAAGSERQMPAPAPGYLVDLGWMVMK